MKQTKINQLLHSLFFFTTRKINKLTRQRTSDIAIEALDTQLRHKQDSL